MVPRRLHTHRIRIDTSFSFKVSEALLASLGQYATLGAIFFFFKSTRFLNFVCFCLFVCCFLYVHYMTTRVKSASSTQMRCDRRRRSVHSSCKYKHSHSSKK